MALGNPIYSVLFVDGDAHRRKAFEDAFSADYHVFAAGRAREALALMDQHSIQLVIAHRDLPDEPGITFLEEAMFHRPDCTRMLQCVPGNMEEIVRAADRGIVFQVVFLPWKKEELKISIDGAMELYFLRRHSQNMEHHLVEIRQTLEHKVMERTRQIEQQRENITDSIHYASRIQKALMPSQSELEELLPAHFILNKPKDIVSGDFYWVSRRNDKLILAVVDCTGHGVPGAFMSILGISLLNEIVGKMEDPGAAAILTELRREVIHALGQTGKLDEAREGMEMALCIVDEVAGIIEFSGAFSPLYLVSHGELAEVRGDRMPIGLYHEEEQPFSSKKIPFSHGDLLYLFSDGYIDQIGGLQRKTFKSGRFKKLIREICQKPLQEQAAILREEHEIWRAGQEQIDDITVLGIRLSR